CSMFVSAGGIFSGNYFCTGGASPGGTPNSAIWAWAAAHNDLSGFLLPEDVPHPIRRNYFGIVNNFGI
ncbi:MAG: hypothetical protein PUE13_08170, partial [Clostridiales bacterium]|nr:hypothetical protein [Clostridiales bacterium]